MSHFFNNIANFGRKINQIDPVDRAAQNFVLGKPAYGNKYGQGPPAPPGPPTQDTAANATTQQQELLRRRRGVYGNVFAGGQAPAPVVQSKSALGS